MRWLSSQPWLAGFRPRRKATQAQEGTPNTSLLGATCHTLDISGQVNRVPELMSGETEALPATRGPHVFPWTTLPSSSPTPAKAECTGKTKGSGGQGRGPATIPRQVEEDWAGGTHAHGRVLQGGLRPASTPSGRIRV